ncbi:hypothetical protein DF19_37725 [Streptomyces olindensis]|nr:hypothetical protein DF19_37725 [Streptomyces olindensis]
MRRSSGGGRAGRFGPVGVVLWQQQLLVPAQHQHHSEHEQRDEHSEHRHGVSFPRDEWGV